MSKHERPATLRQMLAKLQANEEHLPPEQRTDWMDVELVFDVSDGHRKNNERVAARAEYWLMPRAAANPRTGEPARLTFTVHLDEHRLVRNYNRGEGS